MSYLVATRLISAHARREQRVKAQIILGVGVHLELLCSSKSHCTAYIHVSVPAINPITFERSVLEWSCMEFCFIPAFSFFPWNVAGSILSIMSVAPTGPQGEHILVGACAWYTCSLVPKPFSCWNHIWCILVKCTCSSTRESSLVETCLASNPGSRWAGERESLVSTVCACA